MHSIVPDEYRSESPLLLRALAQKTCSADQKLLLDAAAEIEGGEDAYAVLVAQIQALRETLARTERNLQTTLQLVHRKTSD